MIDYYLPWWLGALALTSVVIGFWFFIGRPLGVSGSWARIVMWKDDKAIEQAEAPFRANPQMLQDALMQATIEHFGEEAVYAAVSENKGVTISPPAHTPEQRNQSKATWTMHATFLGMLAVGGLLMAAVSGQYQVQFTLGDLHAELFGSGMGYLMTLFFGGAMVGFGTQLAGGCTSGHALSGCSRLVPASLIATAAFFGTAVVTSLILHFFGGA